MTRIKITEEKEAIKELQELELRSIEIEHKENPTKVVARYYAWWGDNFGEYEFTMARGTLDDLIDDPEDFNYATLKSRLREICMDKLTL